MLNGSKSMAEKHEGILQRNIKPRGVPTMVGNYTPDTHKTNAAEGLFRRVKL
jgi:hypothetical protein